LGRVPHLNLISSLILIAVLFPMMWSLISGQVKAWNGSVRSYLHNEFLQKGNEASLFVALGFFSGAIQVLGTGKLLQQYFVGFVDNTGLFGFALAVPAIIVLLSMVGINNVVGIVLLGTILMPASSSVDPEFLCMLLVIGGSLSIIVSPFSIIAIVTSNLLQGSSYMVTRWNLGYVLFYLLLSAGALTLLFY